MCVIRAYDLMAAGLFYINVTGAGLIAWLDFMQGRSVAISREREMLLAGRGGRHLVLHAARGRGRRRLD